VGLRGTLNEQGMKFLTRLKKDLNSEQDNLLRFLDLHKERVRRKDLLQAPSRIAIGQSNSCEMNDISLNWKKITRGLPLIPGLSSSICYSHQRRSIPGIIFGKTAV
jgi:hypothetical protein